MRRSQRNKSSGVGLERSCGAVTADWVRSTEPEHGVEVLEAWFQGPAYRTHRHDTYAMCLTTSGVQSCAYRGAAESSTPGQGVALHPDEPHGGHAGTDAQSTACGVFFTLARVPAGKQVEPESSSGPGMR